MRKQISLLLISILVFSLYQQNLFATDSKSENLKPTQKKSQNLETKKVKAKVATLKALEIQKGKFVAVEDHRKEAQENQPVQPTIVFLPGVNRGLLASDDFTVKADQAGLSFINMHFSLHPASIGESVKYKDHANQMTSKSMSDLADEVELVIKKMNVKNPIISSLSYSGAVSSELAHRGYQVVVEAAPIGRYDETLNPAQKYWAAVMDWNRAGNYRTIWQAQINSLISQYPQYADIKDQAVEGYTQLSLIMHGFDYRNQDFKLKPNQQRYFVLGENELTERADIQIEAVQKFLDLNKVYDTVFKVPGAGHNVLFDKPDEFIQILKLVISKMVIK